MISTVYFLFPVNESIFWYNDDNIPLSICLIHHSSFLFFLPSFPSNSPSNYYNPSSTSHFHNSQSTVTPRLIKENKTWFEQSICYIFHTYNDIPLLIYSLHHSSNSFSPILFSLKFPYSSPIFNSPIHHSQRTVTPRVINKNKTCFIISFLTEESAFSFNIIIYLLQSALPMTPFFHFFCTSPHFFLILTKIPPFPSPIFDFLIHNS